MIKVGIKAGFAFGLMIGVFASIQTMSFSGMYFGLFSGIFFALAITLFVTSNLIKKQVAMKEEYLWPGEQVLFSELANLVIRPRDYKLKSLAFDELFWMVGLKDKESLGGRLYVTNYRLFFMTHRLNRVRGNFSVFLPTVRSARGKTFLFTDKLFIETITSEVEIIINKPALIAARIQEINNGLKEDKIEKIRNLAKENAERQTDSLVVWKALNVMNTLIKYNDKKGDLSDLMVNPLQGLSAIFLNELLDSTLMEAWQKKYQ